MLSDGYIAIGGALGIGGRDFGSALVVVNPEAIGDDLHCQNGRCAGISDDGSALDCKASVIGVLIVQPHKGPAKVGGNIDRLGGEAQVDDAACGAVSAVTS